MLSDRSAPGDPGEVDAVTRAAEARRAAGDPLVDLTATSPAAVGLAGDEAEIGEALAGLEPVAEPMDPRGAPGARAALVGAGLAPHVDRVTLTAGLPAGYAHLFTLLCDPGDEVLVPATSLARLSHLAHLSSIALVPYARRLDGRWRLDAAELFDAVSERTRAIVAVSPERPTGAYADREDLEALAALGLPLIVDEALHAYPLEAPSDRPRAFALEGSDALVFSLEDGATRLALPWLGLGWIAVSGPEREVAAATDRLARIVETQPASYMAQAALPALLARSTAPDAIRARTAANLATLRAAFARGSVTVPVVEGGWTAMARLPGPRTDAAWAVALVEAGVIVEPGARWDLPDDEAWIALSLLAAPEDLARGADQIARLAR